MAVSLYAKPKPYLVVEKKALKLFTNKNKVNINRKILKKEQKLSKSEEVSKTSRNDGFKFFQRGKHNIKTHKEIFSLYCQSIAHAPNGSEELAYAYSSRSAFLYHIDRYRDCINDIDKALRLSRSYASKVKLLCRSIHCMKALDLDGCSAKLESAKNFFGKIDDSVDSKVKSSLQKLIDRARMCLLQPANAEQNQPMVVAETMNIDVKKVVTEKDLNRIHDTLTLKYNARYGRHIITNQEYEAGDVIFVEDLYANVLNQANRYTYCHNCMKTCWSGVPCSRCTWVMYCDDSCKNEAWNKFHDLECTTLSHSTMMGDELTKRYLIAFRMLILGIKKTSHDIGKLKAEIFYAENDPDLAYKGMKKDGHFDSNHIRSVYNLSTDDPDNDQLMRTLSSKAIDVLIRIAQCTLLLGKDFKLEKAEDLLENEDAVFLGSLFIRLCLIKNTNANPYFSSAWFCDLLKYDHVIGENNYCCERGLCIAPFASLINHSCFPNVTICFTEDQKCVVYALRPIAKGSQIFDAYYGLEFRKVPKMMRRSELDRLFGFVCDCVPCRENWPIQKDFHLTGRTQLEYQLNEYCLKIDRQLSSGITNFDEAAIRTLSKAISKAMKHLKQPSDITCTLIQLLKVVFLCIFNFRPSDFGRCSTRK